MQRAFAADTKRHGDFPLTRLLTSLFLLPYYLITPSIADELHEMNKGMQTIRKEMEMTFKKGMVSK
jgi:hypothetical protein